MTQGGHGVVQLPSVLQRHAEIVVAFGAGWVDGDGLTKDGDGLVQLALLGQHDAEIAEDIGILRFEQNRLTVGRGCLGEASPPAIGLTDSRLHRVGTYAFDPGAQFAQSFVDALESAVDLPDILDD